MPRFFSFAISLLCASSLGAPSLGAAQHLEFEATPNELAWPPSEDVSFPELCRAAGRFLNAGGLHDVTCSVAARQGEHVVVHLMMGAWLELHLFTRHAGRYRYIATVESVQRHTNHTTGVRVLDIHPRVVNGRRFVFLRLQSSHGEYYENGYQRCERERLHVCGESDIVDDCEMEILTRQVCVSGPPNRARIEPSWWGTRNVARPPVAPTDVEVGDDGLLYITFAEGALERDAPRTRRVYRFAPAPAMPEPPPFLEGVCHDVRYEDQWRDRCDDRPRAHRHRLSLQWHSDLQTLCDDVRASELAITACSEEHITRNLAMVRTRRNEAQGPTFLAERRGSSLRVISRMGEPSPQATALRFVQHVRGPGVYYGVELEERSVGAPVTTRRHLLVCQRSRRDPRCSLRVPLRASTQSRNDEPHYSDLQRVHFSQAEAEMLRDGSLALTRVSGSWAELFGTDGAPPQNQERILYRYR